MPRPRPLPVPTVPLAPQSPSTAEILGRPPLIGGDERAGYETLLARVTAAVRPADVLEEAWVRDVVDLIWEAVRARRLKAALMTASADWGVRYVLNAIGVPYQRASELAPAWCARKLDAVSAVDAELDAAGLGIDHVMAQTLRHRIDVIERIDRTAASAEARRAAALREISHYRASFAATLGAAADAAIADAEYAVVETGAPAEGTAATAAQPVPEAAE